MLLARRRELGLTLTQASRTLRLREDVLAAFEEGDFSRLPQSGYAAGMLSSYARYLGLNAREIVDMFQEEYHQFKYGTASHELRRRTRQNQSGHGMAGYEVVNEVNSRPKAYVEYRPLLPSGGGPAGDMGDFATTAPARPRSSVPLAGTGVPAPGTRSSSGYEHVGSYAARSHPYNAADPRDRQRPSTARRRSTQTRRRDDDRASRLISERQRRTTEPSRPLSSSERLYRRDDVSTRRVRPHEYTDDMRYDDETRPYAPASTISGRRSSRNIARVERPNVRRRQARGGSGRGRAPRRGGVVGSFLADPRRALFAIILVVAVALTAILFFSVSSCVNARTQPTTGQTVPVGTVGADDGATTDEGETTTDTGADAGADQTAEQDGQQSAEGETQDAQGEGEQDIEPTVVEVSVERGSVCWVEITCDGRSEIADSVTGPWSASYTVTDTITVQVANPDVVTVTKNGERVDFTSHAGGLGSVTIEGTPLPDTAATGEDGEAQVTEGQQ